jgi:hypothetical protein
VIPLPFLSSIGWRAIAFGAGVFAIVGVGLYIRHTGYAACEEANRAEVAQVIARQATITAAANAKGQALSERLLDTERKLRDTEKEYLTYANAITGHCPASLGVLTSAASSGQPLPPAAGPSAPTAAPIGAAPIAANIAENYTRAWACIAQLNALVDWHEHSKTLTKKKEE